MTNTNHIPRFQAVLFITEPGKWLLGGVKEHRSIWFDHLTDADAWLHQCVKTNSDMQPHLKIHGRIKRATF